MRWIPRLLAGTCVVVAAALTAVPVTAGLADLVLNPGPQSTKRNAQPALTSLRTNTPPVARTEESAVGSASHEVIEGTIVDDSEATGTDSAGTSSAGTDSVGTDSASIASAGTELVAATASDAHARVTELAADLQAGVAAGEFAQADADRVLADIAGYIHGDRTWPERLSA
ncbi:hypothetical protein [Brevibacterium spongiae]|uniref:Uncharacterized protein n=1 Tax=Brevibacterium spongiae TaxID=2909672 RepID=A0ABY5SKA6_9MICO|nr:hypothetical protein [Brevibacterium spongiae]UVI34965.1 hypothetical protein L1F31_12635 [Brevibacterium spongiae]